MAIVRFSLQMGDRLPAHDAVIYTRGAKVNGTQTLVNTVTVHAGHDFIVGHKFYYALSRSNIRKERVFTITAKTSTTVTYSGAAFTWVNDSWLVPLGVDTGAALQSDCTFTDPNYDGSPLSVYSDPAGDSSYLYAVVPVEPGGDLGFWCATSDLWILARDSRQRIVRFYIVSQTSTGGGAGGSVTVAADTSTPGDNNNPSFLVVRNAAAGDKLYVWLKDSADAYHWEEILEIA
jgi:hypothetical protein